MAETGSRVDEDVMDEDNLSFHPPNTRLPEHPLTPQIVEALRRVYDPEIPVNIYEIGLIYRFDVTEQNRVDVKMTLTSPMCPVAGEMPGMVEEAVTRVEGVAGVDVEIVWDPAWAPDMMAETAKLELNMW